MIGIIAIMLGMGIHMHVAKAMEESGKDSFTTDEINDMIHEAVDKTAEDLAKKEEAEEAKKHRKNMAEAQGAAVEEPATSEEGEVVGTVSCEA